MIARPCREPGCPAIATQRGYCADHYRPNERARRRLHDERRGSSTERGYDYHWQKVRRLVLVERPLCEDCWGVGRATPAAEVHHIDGNPRHNDPANLMPLCKPCHSRRTLADRY